MRGVRLIQDRRSFDLLGAQGETRWRNNSVTEASSDWVAHLTIPVIQIIREVASEKHLNLTSSSWPFTMRNIRLEYRYRDYGNHKRYLEVIFSNPDNLAVTKILSMFESARKIAFRNADDDQFSAESLDLPTAYFEGPSNEDDHRWHEFVDFSETDAPATESEGRSVERFLYDLACIAASNAP